MCNVVAVEGNGLVKIVGAFQLQGVYMYSHDSFVHWNYSSHYKFSSRSHIQHLILAILSLVALCQAYSCFTPSVLPFLLVCFQYECSTSHIYQARRFAVSVGSQQCFCPIDAFWLLVASAITPLFGGKNCKMLIEN